MHKLYKIQNRVLLARYRGRTTCYECNGGRLRKEASYIRVGSKNIMELIKLPIGKLKEYFDELELNKTDFEIGRRILTEIKSRLAVMVDVGLSYLTLDRSYLKWRIRDRNGARQLLSALPDGAVVGCAQRGPT